MTSLKAAMLKAVLATVKKCIHDKPGLTTVQATLLLPIVLPSLVVGFILNPIGLSMTGPVAGNDISKNQNLIQLYPKDLTQISGSLATAYQSTYGATSGFSVLQSAAMAGYGTVVVNGIVQGAAGVVAVILELFKRGFFRRK